MKITYVIFIALCLYAHVVNSISIVYNLRISETTRRRLTDEQHRPYIIAATGVDQRRKSYNGIKQNVGATILTFLKSADNLYCKADFAAGKVSERKNNIRASRAQTDDLLITAGYRCLHRKRSSITLSGLLGIPTHRDFALQGFQLGTGHVGVGVQFDGSYIYSHNMHHSLLGAARFVHFASRHVCIKIPAFTQIFDIELGNLTDLLIAHRSTHKRHSFEVGYNPAFAFSLNIAPTLPGIDINSLSFIRSSFYATYACGMRMRSILGAWAFGTSYSFDHRPKTVGVKRGITAWGTFGFTF